jgi:molybdate transport system substrate-binding protein
MKQIYFVFIFAAILFSCNNNVKTEKIKIATAANMQFAMDSLVQIFELETGIQADVSANSSGMLTAQIEKGAPYDVFVSANLKYPETLKSKGLGYKITVYGSGRLAFVYDNKLNYKSIEEALKDKNIGKIAVADPETAPYGMAAKEFLNKNKYFNTIKSQLVYGESINQVNQYLMTNSVKAGFTSYSGLDVFKNTHKFMEVQQSEFSEIKQGAQMLKHGKKHHKDACKLFLKFLKSKKSKAILSHFGYFVK